MLFFSKKLFFRTPIKERRSYHKAGIKITRKDTREHLGQLELLSSDPAYQSMDKETAETLSVLMGINKFNENEETYKTEGGNYNMCQAIRELMEDSRLEGEAHQITEIIENIMKSSRCTLKEACEVAGKTLEEYRQAKDIYTKV